MPSRPSGTAAHRPSSAPVGSATTRWPMAMPGGGVSSAAVSSFAGTMKSPTAGSMSTKDGAAAATTGSRLRPGSQGKSIPDDRGARRFFPRFDWPVRVARAGQTGGRSPLLRRVPSLVRAGFAKRLKRNWVMQLDRRRWGGRGKPRRRSWKSEGVESLFFAYFPPLLRIYASGFSILYASTNNDNCRRLCSSTPN